MITRYAIFEGRIREGQIHAFRKAILEVVAPRWRAMPGVLNVRISFTDQSDAGAPDVPLILAIDYPDYKTLERALASPQRAACRDALEGRVLPHFFDGRLHHHIGKTQPVTDVW